MTSFESRAAYEVWRQVIADEELCAAMLAGNHRELAPSRGLDELQMAVLDAFHAEPGTRWNIENLRFRSAQETSSSVGSYMPLTVKLLTRGDDDWLQELCFEYLAHHRWSNLGHLRLRECERFAAYVRDRVAKRRVPPEHLEPVLQFELAVIRLLKRTSDIPGDAWPTGQVPADDALADSCPRRSPAVELVTLDVDIRDWIATADPLRGGVKPGPVTFLIVVPSLSEVHRTVAVGEGAREVLDRCDGQHTVAALSAELEEEFELPAADVGRLVCQWLRERILGL